VSNPPRRHERKDQSVTFAEVIVSQRLEPMSTDSPEAIVDSALREFVCRGVEFLIIASDPFFVQFAGVYPDGTERRERDAWDRKVRRVEENDRGALFTQLYQEMGLYAEAVSDEFLKPEMRLGETGGARLARLGWIEPSSATPNWSRVHDFVGDESYAVVSRSVIQTFEEGFELLGPLSLKFGNPL